MVLSYLTNPTLYPSYHPNLDQRAYYGAVSSFFGYLGFDAVCCVAGEAINAERNLPLSIMITLCMVTTLYVAAAIALVAMQDYREISPESGFPGMYVVSHMMRGAFVIQDSFLLCNANL